MPHHSVRDQLAAHSLHRQTACVSVSISWLWERPHFQSLQSTVSCALTFTSPSLVFKALHGLHGHRATSVVCALLAVSALNQNAAAFETRYHHAHAPVP